MATLKLEIVTPEAKIYSDDVDIVYVPGVEGELGILPHHIPLMTMIKAGELRVTTNGKETFMAVGEGFVEVTLDSVTVLTDMAVEA
jgi:F-type H+-transporting ATPase subunit epsilon